MEKLKQIIAKKREQGKGKLGGVEAAARGSVLQDLIGSLDKSAGKKLKGVKKVTVASNSEAGVKEGLDKAKEILDQGESIVTGKKDKSLIDQLEESPEYDDRETNAALMDSPEKHITAEDTARGEEADELMEAGEEALEGESHEQQEAEDADSDSLHAEIASLKAEIEKLKAPKSFY